VIFPNILFPAVVIFPLFVLNVIAPVYVKVIPLESVKLPRHVILLLPLKVPVYPVPPVKLILKHEAVALTVQLLTFVEVKNTSSEVEGTDSPVAPPSVAAHELVAFQFPAPEGFQNLFAIFKKRG
jgi:hypothetical protein